MEKRIRVMIADDNQAMIDGIEAYLSDKADMELIAVANDGEQAVKLAAQYKPDIMLLDVIMPRMDGFAVLKALGESRIQPAARVIMLTGLRRDDFIERAMRLGASYYMVKPVDMDILFNRIREIYALTSAPAPSAEKEEVCVNIDEQITNLFLTIGIPAHIRGYQYLREAVKMVIDDHDVIGRITKELYPSIARRFDVTASKVERAMRHAIEVAWNRGRLESVNRMYGYSLFSPNDKPTNGEFIALIADKLATSKQV
ncbi:MAG: sporulation transcription factor Spo0A [Clostridia bacterium]|nr:sporulation transcription factor Spo0A [Clostridia bacterium]